MFIVSESDKTRASLARAAFKRDFLVNQKGRRSRAGVARERMYEGRVLVAGGGVELPEPSPLSTSYPHGYQGNRWVGVPEPSPLSTSYPHGSQGNPF